MTWIPAMVVALSVGIVPSWKWGPKRCQLNWLDVSHPYQLWKQLSVNDGNGVPSWFVLLKILSIRFASWGAWQISGSRCCLEARWSCRSWLPQVGAISSTWQIARSLDEWSRDLSIWQGWWASRMHYLGPDMVFEQTCQSGQSFLYLSDIVPKFFLNVL